MGRLPSQKTVTIPKFPKHAQQFRCKKNELHTASVRHSNTVEREGGRDRDRREEEAGREGWKGQFFPQKEKQVESWTRGSHLLGDTVRERLNANTERRQDSRVTDSTALIERMLFTIATGVTCSNQRHSMKHTGT